MISEEARNSIQDTFPDRIARVPESYNFFFVLTVRSFSAAFFAQDVVQLYFRPPLYGYNASTTAEWAGLELFNQCDFNHFPFLS